MGSHEPIFNPAACAVKLIRQDQFEPLGGGGVGVGVPQGGGGLQDGGGLQGGGEPHGGRRRHQQPPATLFISSKVKILMRTSGL